MPEQITESPDAAPDTAPSTAAEADGGRIPIYLLGASFLAATVLVLVISATGMWDPYVCHSESDCRSLKECLIYNPVSLPEDFEVLEDMGITPRQPAGYCISPEVWERQSTHARVQRIMQGETP